MKIQIDEINFQNLKVRKPLENQKEYVFIDVKENFLTLEEIKCN